jgi:hypothetical protein
MRIAGALRRRHGSFGDEIACPSTRKIIVLLIGVS